MKLRAAVLAACCATPLTAHAQDRERCELLPGPNTTMTRVATPGGQGNTFMGRGVNVRCPKSDLTLRSDSLESYGDEGRLFLLGNVHYDEPRLNLTSDYLTYFQRDERAVAQGNVNARLPDSSTLRGPLAEYFRVIPGRRPATRLTASGRPTITLVQKDSAGIKPPPTVVVANNVLMVGDSLVYAGGQVIVTREDVVARGDSMNLDSEREITVMMRSPSISGRRQDKPFTLSGIRIELTGRARKLNRVLAKGNAKAVSSDMTLVSDTIDLRVAKDLLQRAIAWGPSRADASSASQRILSDSIDVLMPDQRVREMHAVRKALAEGKPDSTRFRADTLDWMRGDTIVARFDTTAVPGDTARAARLRELIAVGNARSYYHLAPADTTVRQPAINYVSGREIVVAFENQRVAKVTVVNQAAGVYLEPKPGAAKPDTARAATKTAAPPARTVPPTTAPPTATPPRRPPAPR